MSSFTVNIKLGEDELSLSNEDIIEINVIEDIYDFCMSGNITFYDRVGWMELFENLGAFIPLAIMWEENGIEPTRKTFQVFATEVIIQESIHEPVKKIKWYFLEPMLSSLSHRRYSLAWGEEKKGSEIISDISKNILGIESTSKFIEFEETVETFDNFYMPYWTAAEAITWIKMRCSSSKSQQAGYLFFNNSLGTNFVTLGTLMSSTKRETDENGQSMKYIFSSTGGEANKIIAWELHPPEYMNVPEFAGGKSFGFNPDSKELLTLNHTYTDQFKDSETGASISLFGNSTSFPDITTPNAAMILEGESDTKKMYNMYNHIFITKYLPQMTAHIIIRGESTRYAGMIIDTEWKSMDSQIITDKQLEGLWLVKSITHQFVPLAKPPYRQRMVCIKPGPNKTEGDLLYKPDKASKVQTEPYVTKR
jgi:hypothetical protein